MITSAAGKYSILLGTSRSTKIFKKSSAIWNLSLSKSIYLARVRIIPQSPNIHTYAAYAFFFFSFYYLPAEKVSRTNEQSVGKIWNRLTACRACDALLSIFPIAVVLCAWDARIDPIRNRAGALNSLDRNAHSSCVTTDGAISRSITILLIENRGERFVSAVM